MFAKFIRQKFKGNSLKKQNKQILGNTEKYMCTKIFIYSKNSIFEGQRWMFIIIFKLPIMGITENYGIIIAVQEFP